jgi:hypothetical protein
LGRGVGSENSGSLCQWEINSGAWADGDSSPADHRIGHVKHSLCLV